MTDREKHIKNLSYIMDSMPDDACGDWRDSLAFAISSIKTDLKYDLMYEGKEEIYTKADIVAMLEELDFRLSNYQGTDLIRQDIQEKIDKLKEVEQ